MTDEKLIREHAQHLRRQDARPRTVRERTDNLARLARNLAPVELTAATDEDLARWQDRLRAAALSTETIRCYTCHARGFYGWLEETGRRDDNPARNLRPPRVPAGRARPIDESKLQVALACARGELHVWLVCAAFLGLRAGEVARMRTEDVGADLLDIPDGKGGRSRTVPLPPQVRELLMPYVHAGSGRMWTTRLGTPVTPEYVSSRCNRHLRECAAGPGITMHSLRHSFATRLYRLSSDPRLVQTYLGHTSLATTARYLAVDSVAGAHWVGQLATDLDRTA